MRMLLTMGVSLYTSRIVLSELGISDYGVYNVVGGVVMLFSSLNTTMATAVQRFMNFEMGKNNSGGLHDVFNTSVIIHFFIAGIVFLLLETIGVWFLNTQMNIDPLKLEAANWVLQFSIFTFMITVVSVPYNAAIIANEKMQAFAIISIVDVLLKLLIAFSLSWIGFDKLKVYAVLMFLVAVLLRMIYGIYARRNFKECRFIWKWDRNLFREMMSFAGWNMIGVSSTMIRTQGINIVLNLFFSTVVNAAMGIANQVKQTVDNFTNNFLTALAPQITKSYASKDFDYLMKLIFRGSKYSFYLLLLITLPILIETEFLLGIWLKEVPGFTVVFVRLVLIISIIESLSKTLIQTMFATGDIKKYQIIVGSVTVLNLPLAILFLYLGFKPEITLVIGVVIAIFALFVRLKMLKSMVSLNVRKYLTKVVLVVFTVSVLAISIPLAISFFMEQGFARFLITGFSSIVFVAVSVFLVGLSVSEKDYIISKMKEFITKKIKK
jgi:O-antigen/teichoic acid export membrane protein